MDSACTICPAARSDLDALVELERRGFAGDRLSRRQLAHHLRSATAAVWVARVDDRPVADAVVLFRRGSPLARLYSLVVAGEARGRGVGRALLATAEQDAAQRGCREMRLEVRDDNRGAIGLYERAGYRPRDLRPGYYEDGADARRYFKTL